MTRAALGALCTLVLVAAGCSNAEPGRSTATHRSTPATAAPVVRAAAAPQPIAAPVTSATPTPTPTQAPPNPCAGNHAAQLVKVSLRHQHLWMCARQRLAYGTPITSGMLGEYTETPTGDYVVQGVTRDTSLTLLSGDTYAVKYWIPFDGPLFGFHDSSWQTFPYGSPRYRTDGSHGCVHMPLAAIAFLARWAQPGSTKVSIRA